MLSKLTLYRCSLTPNLEKTLPILLPILIARIPQGKSSVSFEIRGTNFNSFQIKLVTKNVTNLKNSDGRTGNLDVQRQNNNYLFRDKMKIIANTNNMWSWKRNSGHSRSWPLLIIILEKEWIGRYPGQIWKMPGLLSSTSRRELQLDANTFS